MFLPRGRPGTIFTPRSWKWCEITPFSWNVVEFHPFPLKLGNPGEFHPRVEIPLPEPYETQYFYSLPWNPPGRAIPTFSTFSHKTWKFIIFHGISKKILIPHEIHQNPDFGTSKHLRNLLVSLLFSAPGPPGPHIYLKVQISTPFHQNGGEIA